MVAKRALFVAVLFAAGSVLGACGSDPVPVVTMTPTPVSESRSADLPTDSALSTSSPGAPAPAPIMPDLARQQTVEGAAAFAAYWFDLVNWSWVSNETDELASISASDCEYCNIVLEGTREAQRVGAVQVDGGSSISDLSHAESFSEKHHVFNLLYTENAGRLTLPDGTAHQEWDAVETVPRKVLVVWDDGRWTMGGFGERVQCVDCA